MTARTSAPASSRAWLGPIQSAFDAAGIPLTPEGVDCWSFGLRNGAEHTATARLVDGWVCFVLPLGNEPPAAGLDWLLEAIAMNCALPAGSKIVVAADRSVKLQVEFALVEEMDLDRRIREACDALRLGWDFWSKREHPITGNHMAPSDPDDSASKAVLSLCEEAGWACVRRASGRLTVDLEVFRGSHQATLSLLGEGVRVSVELADWGALTGVCRQAISLLLLTANGVVRQARGSIAEGEARSSANFELVFGHMPKAEELAAALSSLSVGVDLCGQEVQALQDETTAREYLAIRGWTS